MTRCGDFTSIEIALKLSEVRYRGHVSYKDLSLPEFSENK